MKRLSITEINDHRLQHWRKDVYPEFIVNQLLRERQILEEQLDVALGVADELEEGIEEGWPDADNYFKKDAQPWWGRRLRGKINETRWKFEDGRLP